jgi:hypothetical protein
MFTSRIRTWGWHKEGICGVAVGHCAHRCRLGDFGQVLGARALASLHHVDLDIFAHGVVRLGDSCGHCQETKCLWLEL